MYWIIGLSNQFNFFKEINPISIFQLISNGVIFQTISNFFLHNKKKKEEENHKKHLSLFYTNAQMA